MGVVAGSLERSRQKAEGQHVGGAFCGSVVPHDVGRPPRREAGQLLELCSTAIIQVEAVPRMPEFVQDEELARIAEVDHADVTVRVEVALEPTAPGLPRVDVHAKIG